MALPLFYIFDSLNSILEKNLDHYLIINITDRWNDGQGFVIDEDITLSG